MTKDSEDNTELTPVFGTMVDIANSKELLQSMEDTVADGARGGGVSYMSFSGKKGTYKIGVDGRSPGEDEPFLVAVPSFELGWICWKDGKPIAKRLANISQPKITEPPSDEGGPFDKDGEGWYRGRSITVRSFDNGEQCYFSINSKSGVAVMADLQREVLERLRSGQPAWPVVTFGSEPFTSGGFPNDKPVITPIAWLDTEDIQKLSDPEFNPMDLLEQETETAPTPRKRRL